MGDILKPGSIIKPEMDATCAQDLLLRLYGLKARSCTEFNSYDDRNYYFVVEEISGNAHIPQPSPHGYVLKVTNSTDSKDENFTDAQNALILHLSKELPVPEPMPNLHGSRKSLETIGGKQHMVRLLKYVPGKILYDVPVWTVRHFHQCGQFIARMDRLLADFSHPAYSTRNSIWFLSSIPALSQFIGAVSCEKRRQLALSIIDEFCACVKPIEESLERGIIHGDFNEQNILVKKRDRNDLEGDEEEEYDIHSVLDFGDSQLNPLVYELAITIMYMMTQCKSIAVELAGGHVIAGYLEHRELPPTERRILRTCVAARYAQSLVMGAYSHQQDPHNEYLLITSKSGWDILGRFWSIPHDHLLESWDRIIADYLPQQQGYLSSALHLPS